MDRVYRAVAAPLDVGHTVIALAAALGPATLSYAASMPSTKDGDDWVVIAGLVGASFAGALTSPEAMRAALAPVAALTEVEAEQAWAQIDVSDEDVDAVIERLGLTMPAEEARP